MSWDHQFIGFSAFEGFVKELQEKGEAVSVENKADSFIRGRAQDCGCDCPPRDEMEFGGVCEHCKQSCDHYQPLRRAEYRSGSGRRMVVEEYLLFDDHDCDGESIIALSIHPADITPLFQVTVLEAS